MQLGFGYAYGVQTVTVPDKNLLAVLTLQTLCSMPAQGQTR